MTKQELLKALERCPGDKEIVVFDCRGELPIHGVSNAPKCIVIRVGHE